MQYQPEPVDTLSPALARVFAPEIRAWRGKAGLATVFWFYGVLTSFTLLLFYARIVYLRLVIAEQILLILFGLYTIWILVSIWRCSLASGTAWAQLARFLTVAWAGNAVMVLFFRQLELLAIFAGIPAFG